jgi:hypothetical protein
VNDVLSRAQHTQQAGRPTLVVIGDRADRQFDAIQRRISPDQIFLLADFRTVADALESGIGESLRPDLLIVLQQYSDQYNPDDVSLLIGRMLFGRVLCCCGPWCLSEGRTHDVWPISIRVPAASAPTVIDQELRALAEAIESLLPMSAAEEVFAHRVALAARDVRTAKPDVWILTSEEALGRMVAKISHMLHVVPRHLPMQIAALNQAIESGHRPDLILIDLDPLDDLCRTVLQYLDQQGFMSKIVGMSVFPFADFRTVRIKEVLCKTELLQQLPAWL